MDDDGNMTVIGLDGTREKFTNLSEADRRLEMVTEGEIPPPLVGCRRRCDVAARGCG